MSQRKPKGAGQRPLAPKTDPDAAAVRPDAAPGGSPTGATDTEAKEHRTTLPKSHLGLIEMGLVGEFAVRVVAAHVQTLIGIPVDVLKPLEIPQEAFQTHRQQYDAGLVIRYLNELAHCSHERILGLVTADLCSPILTYVYGEAEIGGRVAVVSTYRLARHEDGSHASKDCYYARLAKVALHEVAHTFSLYHCDAPQCLMHFSPKLAHLDRIALSFCERCEFMLRENVFETYRRAPKS